jgi:type II secretory pathway pseudopilin PulG
MRPKPARLPSAVGETRRGYLLIEVLVYIAVIGALLGAGYAAMYRCIDSSIALRRNADDITSALHAGERWRADVRSATSSLSVETTESGQMLSFDSPRGIIAYHSSTNGIFRSVGGGPWTRLLPNVKSSTMQPDPRQYAKPWCWELELATRARGSVKPGRVRPLFTFIAVPAGGINK